MKKWYVIKTQTGYENKVKDNLLNAVKVNNLNDRVEKIIVPEFIEIDVKTNKVNEKAKKIFPGYVLIYSEIDDDIWFVLRNTMGVFGLLGSSGGGTKPVPLSDEEYLEIEKRQDSKVYKNSNVKLNETVEINIDPYKGKTGIVVEKDEDNKKILVKLNTNVTVPLFYGEIKKI